jgi:integrase
MTRVRPIVADWTLHDLRRYMRSGMARIGITQTVAEPCLGHIAGGLVGVYDQHSYASEKAEAWRRWGEHLSKLTGAT